MISWNYPGGPNGLRVLLNRGRRMSVGEWQCDDEERLERCTSKAKEGSMRRGMWAASR